ncbi:hypothetical protein SEUCBS139899_010281 [Sporothrix eucalyptigena]
MRLLSLVLGVAAAASLAVANPCKPSPVSPSSSSSSVSSSSSSAPTPHPTFEILASCPSITGLTGAPLTFYGNSFSVQFLSSSSTFQTGYFLLEADTNRLMTTTGLYVVLDSSAWQLDTIYSINLDLSYYYPMICDPSALTEGTTMSCYANTLPDLEMYTPTTQPSNLKVHLFNPSTPPNGYAPISFVVGPAPSTTN